MLFQYSDFFIADLLLGYDTSQFVSNQKMQQPHEQYEPVSTAGLEAIIPSTAINHDTGENLHSPNENEGLEAGSGTSFSPKKKNRSLVLVSPFSHQ